MEHRDLTTNAPSSQGTGACSKLHQVVLSMQVLAAQAVVLVVSVPLLVSVGSGGSGVQGLLPEVPLVHV